MGALPEPQDREGQGIWRVTAKALAVLEALLWAFHNAKSGLCFPSYETDRRGRPLRPVDRRRGYQGAGGRGGPHWVQRIKRVRERVPDLLGDNGWRWRVLRTSNAYAFSDPSPPPIGRILLSPKSRLEHRIKIFPPIKGWDGRQNHLEHRSQSPSSVRTPSNGLTTKLLRFM